VDVLSFSTAVVAACEAGAVVYPYRWKDGTARAFARSVGAELASPRPIRIDPEALDSGAVSQYATGNVTPASLSPLSLTSFARKTSLVLPSPNGSTLSTLADAPMVLCGCLRNATALADVINQQPGVEVVVVAAGERWPDGSLRPALEDLLGAGAIVAGLDGEPDVEAMAARAVYQSFADRLIETLEETMSGRELRGIGYGGDVRYAGAANASECVPVLRSGVYTCLS
jgi:2-phosphosulfolactate phosphatase